MKLKHIIICALAVLTTAGASAATTKDGVKKSFRPKISLGVHTGLDMGAAAPYPPSSLGSGSKINAVPYLTPALGLSGRTDIDEHWSVGVETTYKRFGIEATAWVTSQRFRDPNDPERIVSFRGTTDINMRFAMLEVPLYAGYTFGKRYNRVILGPYYARIFKSDFTASPKKGMVTNVNNPDDFAPVTPEDPFTQDFSNDMRKWDIGFLAGYETKLIERVNLGVRFSMGFNDIFKQDARALDYKMLHMRGTVVISYRLFDFNNK